jgi:hypothetical protein
MYTNASLSEQLKKLDKELTEIANSKEHSLTIIESICSSVDSYVLHPSIDVLNTIFNYYKDSKFIQTAESRRLYVICTILKTELENNSASIFSSNLNNVQELYDRYIHCIFMIRRLLLDVPYELKSEAEDYLTGIDLSPYAYISLLSNELYEDYEYALHIIANLMHDRWNPLQNAYFAMHIAECFPTENNYLNVASYCMALQPYNLAYEYLLQIPDPSPTTLELLLTLKGALNE